MNSLLYVAASWIREWDPKKRRFLRENCHFYLRDGDAYKPALNLRFSTLMIGGMFPGAEDPLGGLDPTTVATVDILDPRVEEVSHVHMRGIAQILIDLNVMTDAEAAVLREGGVDRVIQSNIGGPNKAFAKLEEMASAWCEGQMPGCSCKICCRIPIVLHKLRGQLERSPADVLPLTTIPRLQHVVDKMICPSVKIVLGSQGCLGQPGSFQRYPSAAVGFVEYLEVQRSPLRDEFPVDVDEAVDPDGVMQQERAPSGYEYVRGIVWLLGRELQRMDGDPDQHVFGFVFVRDNSGLSTERVREEACRFVPRTQQRKSLG